MSRTISGNPQRTVIQPEPQDLCRLGVCIFWQHMRSRGVIIRLSLLNAGAPALVSSWPFCPW
ncbi:hypothetical protein M2262_005109 [Pseudomonas sp. BIGb0408]|uniref:Uncharacterized protein n=1 Tax=Phytopseudomonas flavescens TaxID=29435 RepID=A0A7Z0BQE9_9GAMM|nr:MULTISPECIES: hypothetical protein [Pseudomonas]MCW2295059.1 hypothetical protein [Pseudomonas sp. BIGb0408]NYH75667.1 hypothetical protein [Pseudomonas flavescens]